MIRLGLIGAGANGGEHARYFARSPRCRLVAIADPVAERASQLAAETGAAPVADFRELLDGVDAVIVSSPNYAHCEQAVACATAGRHVYCEKPMGLSLAEAREIASAVNAAGVRSVVGFNTRFTPPIQTMLRLADEGAFGRLRSIFSRRQGYIAPAQQSAWRNDHHLSGGLLMEINIHELDWMMRLGGKVESVYARAWAARPDGPRSNDHLWFTLNFERDAVGLHEGGWLSSIPAYYRSVEGELGGACTDEWGSLLYYARPGENRAPVDLSPAFDLRAHFLDCIESGAPSVADVNWGLEVMAVAEALLSSAASGAVTPVPSPVAARIA